MLVINKLLTANEISDIENDNKLIEKCGKLLKTRKLFKSNKKLSKFKKSLVLEHIFTLVFTNIKIETKAAYFLEKWFFKIFNIKLTMQSFWSSLDFKIWRFFSKLQSKSKIKLSSKTL